LQFNHDIKGILRKHSLKGKCFPHSAMLKHTKFFKISNFDLIEILTAVMHAHNRNRHYAHEHEPGFRHFCAPKNARAHDPKNILFFGFFGHISTQIFFINNIIRLNSTRAIDWCINCLAWLQKKIRPFFSEIENFSENVFEIFQYGLKNPINRIFLGSCAWAFLGAQKCLNPGSCSCAYAWP
jgi:hypothetical protein